MLLQLLLSKLKQNMKTECFFFISNARVNHLGMSTRIHVHSHTVGVATFWTRLLIFPLNPVTLVISLLFSRIYIFQDRIIVILFHCHTFLRSSTFLSNFPMPRPEVPFCWNFKYLKIDYCPLWLPKNFLKLNVLMCVLNVCIYGSFVWNKMI